MTVHRIRVQAFRPSWWPGRWAYEAVCSCGSRSDHSGLTSWRSAMWAADWHRKAMLRAAVPDDLSSLGAAS